MAFDAELQEGLVLLTHSENGIVLLLPSSPPGANTTNTSKMTRLVHAIVTCCGSQYPSAAVASARSRRKKIAFPSFHLQISNQCLPLA